MLWEIAMYEDSRSLVTFNDEWKHLVDFVNNIYLAKQSKSLPEVLNPIPETEIVTSLPTQDTISKELLDSLIPETIQPPALSPTIELHCSVKFINSLYEKKSQWIRRFIVVESASRTLLLGNVRTTQRNEAINRVVAEDTSPSNRLVDAFRGIYSRQKLRHVEIQAKLVTEVKTTLQIPYNLDVIFHDLLKFTTKYIATKILEELKRLNEYCYEILENKSNVNGQDVLETKFNVFVDNKEGMDSKTSEEGSRQSKLIKTHFRNTGRLITIVNRDNGLKYLDCSCMNVSTRGYPCRHILLIYSVECKCRNKQLVYAPLHSYVNSYWSLSNVLYNFGVITNTSVRIDRTIQGSGMHLTDKPKINGHDIIDINQHEDQVNDFKVRYIS
jgi:hypothetical protein